MSGLRAIFGVDKPLIAMCHLAGLPGRPRYDAAGGMDRIVELASRDLAALQDNGVDAVLFCNENDIPYSTSVGVEQAAAMAAVVGRLRGEIRVPYGVNLLWDPRKTIAVAAATGASFVREVFTGVYDSDMGVLRPTSARSRATGTRSAPTTCRSTPTSRRSSPARWGSGPWPSVRPAPRSWAPTRC